jgi:hypothetical protein
VRLTALRTEAVLDPVAPKTKAALKKGAGFSARVDKVLHIRNPLPFNYMHLQPNALDLNRSPYSPNPKP